MIYKYNYLVLMAILLGIFIYGCSGQSGQVSKSKVTAGKSVTSDLAGKKLNGSTDPYEEIVSKDIFTPPDMRRAAHEPPRPVMVEKIQPQKLTITGIVFDGEQYMVSIENRDTGETKYLHARDTIVNYPITAIDFNHIKVLSKKKELTYAIRDQIPLPDTVSPSSKVSPNASVASEDLAALSNDTTGGQENTTISTIPASGASMEEMLRIRRQQQEAALK